MRSWGRRCADASRQAGRVPVSIPWNARCDRSQLLRFLVCFWILKVRKWQRSEGPTRTQLLAPFFGRTDHELTGQQRHVVTLKGADIPDPRAPI